MENDKTTPKVSVIMPVYNAERYLRETLDSLLRQTFTDFECLAINDGSTDNSLEIIKEYAARDPRIVAIDQKNKGLVATLNEGIKRSRGPYIARMDADDPSFEERLQLQVEALDGIPEVVLVGGGFEIIDENGYYIETIHTPTRDEDIRRTMLLRNPFGHAGVMFRKDAFIAVGDYSHRHGPTEDFELWIRLAEYGGLANIPCPIYRYRIVSGGISQSNSELQTKHTLEHIASRWSKEQPRVISRREILRQANRYLHQGVRHSYGIGLKEQFLLDNAQIGVKLIRNGNIGAGVRQLFAVASIGRSGLRATKKRLMALDTGSFAQVFKLKRKQP